MMRRTSIDFLQTSYVTSWPGAYLPFIRDNLLRIPPSIWTVCGIELPRKRHRISPLFNLHIATGRSEYLTERCRKHFNNKYYNNFLDSTSLKSSGEHCGIDMARELHSNLIVCIEDFSNLTEKFKQICGHSSTSNCGQTRRVVTKITSPSFFRPTTTPNAKKPLLLYVYMFTRAVFNMPT